MSKELTHLPTLLKEYRKGLRKSQREHDICLARTFLRLHSIEPHKVGVFWTGLVTDSGLTKLIESVRHAYE